MNRNLLVFSLFIIVAGLAFGLYIISFFGLLLLIPALVAPTRPPTRNAPTQPTQPQPQPWGRVIPPRSRSPPPIPSPRTERVAPPAPHMASTTTSYLAPSPSPTQPISYAPALFPSPLLPPMSIASTPQPAKPPQETKPEGRDELVEAGAVLAILKLILG